VGTNWQLTDYWDGQGATVAALPGVAVTAVFGTDNQLTGSAGCNTYNAAYTLLTIPGSLTIGPPTATNMLCTQPDGLMTQEQIYLANLATITTYQITNDMLELRNAQGQTVLWFSVP
jgi:heat shock protein HslJ